MYENIAKSQTTLRYKVLEPIDSPAALTRSTTSRRATNISNLKSRNLGAKMLKVDAMIPITRIVVFGLALCRIMVAAIRNAAVARRDVMRPSEIGRLVMPLALSSLKSFRTLAKCADIPSRPPAQYIHRGGVRSVAITSAAGRSAKARAYGIGENAVGFK